jgi:proteasome lid subunit RPN8/RPN11
MAVKVTSGAIATLVGQSLRGRTVEVCGLLLGRGELIEQALPCANVHPDPARHFELDPAALIAAHKAARMGGPEVLGYFHSHPTGLAEPSAEDQACASGDGRIWAILAGMEIGWWRDAPDGFEQVRIAAVEALRAAAAPPAPPC